VPITIPDRVTGTAFAAFAIPKSVSFTLPSTRMRMLPGLTSRCTKPRSCAACSARAACSMIRNVCSGSSGPRAISDDSGSPRTSSITR
jgi:hypothetical protein